MALTKDKLVSRLQTQMGLTKQESRQAVERLFEIMKDTLANGEDLLISGYGKFSVRQKNARRGRNPQTKEALMLTGSKGFGVQGLWGATQAHKRKFLGCYKSSWLWPSSSIHYNAKNLTPPENY